MSEYQREQAAVTRRDFLSAAAIGFGMAAGVGTPLLAQQQPAQQTPRIDFPPIQSPTERRQGPPPNPDPPESRVGFAVVGLGRLALGQVLPAFGESRRARLVALVSGDPAKAATVARQHGIEARHVYSYDTFDRIRDDASIEAVYIALPNHLHSDYTVRAAQAGKHVLSEKAMAASVAQAERMVEACRAAGRKLMVAYRIQYEPYNRQAMQIVRRRELGVVKVIEMVNGQAEGTPDQWRLRQEQSGGGSLYDVGIYCLNTARFLTGEEPVEISAMWHKTPDDARFRDVPEESINFQLRFPSGILVNAVSSFGLHRAQRYRVLAEDGWAELDPAFPYDGLRMRVTHATDRTERVEERQIEPKNQFATELDHFAQCVRENRQPYTPGEEGLQDMRLMQRIYDSARNDRPVTLDPAARPDAFRGPAPQLD